MTKKIGILLVNLGTPNTPSTSDVRTYLNEFLTDARVINYSWLPRQILVRGIITPFRAPNSAKSYRAIWDEKNGSPLKYISYKLTELLQLEFNEQSHTPTQYVVQLAMRYQIPSIQQGLYELKKQAVSEYIIVPLFPQYASASTGSVHERVMQIVSKWEVIPPIKFINSYYNHPDFINAFVQIGKQYAPNTYDHILFSFHGLPEKQLKMADDTQQHCLCVANCCSTINLQNQFCYSAQCHATAHAIANELGLNTQNYTICYQSRLGKEPWVKPYTSAVLEELAHKGVKKLLVFCPAFVADCLETIFEVSVEYNEEFKKLGGEHVQLVESLNSTPLWVKALKNIILEN